MGLSKQERDRQYDEAKAFIDLMHQRIEQETGRELGSIMALIERVLRGIQPAPFDASKASNISPKLMWAIDVGCVLRDIGPEAAFILRARLGRRQKSHAQSWPVIIQEMDRYHMPVTEQEAKRILSYAIPLFLFQLEAKGITRNFQEIAAA